jgi:hypothetical protein
MADAHAMATKIAAIVETPQGAILVDETGRAWTPAGNMQWVEIPSPMVPAQPKRREPQRSTVVRAGRVWRGA